MKLKFLFAVLVVFALPVFAANCMDTAVTQADINQCAGSKQQKADAELNQLYQQALVLAKKDPVATDKIRQAERAWLKYRDAQVAMHYPPRAQGEYGSVQSLCEATLLQKLTENRIKELKEWLKTPEEGDVCSRNLNTE